MGTKGTKLTENATVASEGLEASLSELGIISRRKMLTHTWPADIPASRPVAQDAWRLYPPVNPSIFITSPAK